jgi:CheY-like chemotaxis protein
VIIPRRPISASILNGSGFAGETLDLAICDINLWDGDGCDLLQELRDIQPLQAIAVTGYTLPEETEHYREAGFAVVLHKPSAHLELPSAIALLTSDPPMDDTVFQKATNESRRSSIPPMPTTECKSRID